MPTLKPEYQARLDLVREKPFVLTRFWDWDSEADTWKEAEIARGKTLKGLKAFCRLNKIPTGTGEYRIERETVELVEGWYPTYDTEIIEEL